MGDWFLLRTRIPAAPNWNTKAKGNFSKAFSLPLVPHRFFSLYSQRREKLSSCAEDEYVASNTLVVVVGAGPAGIYGTRKLVEAGHRVVLLNRDIKPGGLAEYGIFVDKEKMKTGLRKQFKKILADQRYFISGTLPSGQIKR